MSFVATQVPRKRREMLQALVTQAVQFAIQSGYTSEQFIDTCKMVFSRAQASQSSAQSHGGVWR